MKRCEKSWIIKNVSKTKKNAKGIQKKLNYKKMKKVFNNHAITIFYIFNAKFINIAPCRS